MHSRRGWAVALALVAGVAGAAEPKMKPFVLASRGPGDPAQVVEETRAKLAAAGLEVAASRSSVPAKAGARRISAATTT